MPLCKEVEGRFYYDYEMPEHYFDKNNNLKVSNLQRMAQDTSSKHLSAVGYDYETLVGSGYVYLLVYSKMKFYKEFKLWQKVRVSVWPKSERGARSYRDIIFAGDDGGLLAEVSTVWVLADAVNHKIVPPTSTPVKLVKIDDRPLKIGDAKRIKMPVDIKKVGERRVVYTDLDPNNHMNNCNYSDVFLDFSGVKMEKYQLEEFEINYRSEALLGDNIEIFTKEIENDGKKEVYLRGVIDGKPSFDCFGRFKNR